MVGRGEPQDLAAQVPRLLRPPQPRLFMFGHKPQRDQLVGVQLKDSLEVPRRLLELAAPIC